MGGPPCWRPHWRCSPTAGTGTRRWTRSPNERVTQRAQSTFTSPVRRTCAPPCENAELMAGVVLALMGGLYQEKLIDPDGVPDDSLGEMLALAFAGHVARAGARV